MAPPIILRCIKQPYIVLSVLIVPISALGLFAAIKSGLSSNWPLPFLPLVMLGLIFSYFKRLTLALKDNEIIYREAFKSKKISLGDIRSIERGHGPFRSGATWIIRCHDLSKPIIFNVTNFDSADLREFTKVLLTKAPGIKFSAAKLAAPQ